MKLLFLIFFSFLTLTAPAQFTNLSYNPPRLTKQVIRETINFDYSVPDYSVATPDASVMGWRLAAMLQYLERNFDQGLHSQALTKIRNRQLGEAVYSLPAIDKIKILNVQKQDSVITIRLNTFTKANKKKIDVDLVFTFTNSVSADDSVNHLFMDFARYIRKDGEGQY